MSGMDVGDHGKDCRRTRLPKAGPARSASQPSFTSSLSEAERTEDRYFDALVAGDAERLEEISEDFLIVDVMSGGARRRTEMRGSWRRSEAVSFEHRLQRTEFSQLLPARHELCRSECSAAVIWSSSLLDCMRGASP